MTDKKSQQQILKLNNATWDYAAKLNCLSVKDWVVSTLNEAAHEVISSEDQDKRTIANRVEAGLDTKILDSIPFKDLKVKGNPHRFQFIAMRHWAGLTQSEAANAIGISSSSYRSCESLIDGITMDSLVWEEYVDKTLELMLSHDYDTLPNSFGRALKGLIGMSYGDLDQKSNLSQSYWTARLRFKKDPIPLELVSIKEMLRLAIKGVDKKFKEGGYTEARLMLASLLFFAYHTQRIRVEKNPSLVSVMHTFALPGNERSKFIKVTSGGRRSNPVNKTNLYHLTVSTLANKGYIFSDNFPDAQFQHCD